MHVLRTFPHALLLPLGTAVICLAGCTPLSIEQTDTEQQPVEQHNTAPQIGSGDSRETAGELPGQVAETIDPLSQTGNTILPERLLPGGILEIGSPDAPHTLLVVTEHHCRYCRELASQHLQELRTSFVREGILKLHIAILPLEKYAGSSDAALALLCAAHEGRGAAMHDILSNATAMDRSSLRAYARDIGMTDEAETAFSACLDDPTTQEAFSAAQTWLRSLHVNLVPTLFLDGEKAVGLPYWADLRGWIATTVETSD